MRIHLYSVTRKHRKGCLADIGPILIGNIRTSTTRVVRPLWTHSPWMVRTSPRRPCFKVVDWGDKVTSSTPRNHDQTTDLVTQESRDSLHAHFNHTLSDDSTTLVVPTHYMCHLSSFRFHNFQMQQFASKVKIFHIPATFS